MATRHEKEENVIQAFVREKGVTRCPTAASADTQKGQEINTEADRKLIAARHKVRELDQQLKGKHLSPESRKKLQNDRADCMELIKAAGFGPKEQPQTPQPEKPKRNREKSAKTAPVR